MIGGRLRCHRRGIAGKLGLATQWAFEQEEAGGEVNFKEGLAFYSSIGILQVRGRERERELAGMQHFLELVVALIYVYLSQDRFDSSYLYIYIYASPVGGSR